MQTFAQKELEYFTERKNTYGLDDVRAFGYSAQEKQTARFNSVLRVLEGVSFDSVLDIGCGRGDFYDRLRYGRTKFSYKGIDIVDEFVSRASWEHALAVWAKQTIFDVGEVAFDLVVAISTFTKKSSDSMEASKEFVFDSLEEAWAKTRKALIFTLELDNMWEIPKDDVVFSIEEVLQFAKGNAARYELRVRELDYDVTVGMFKC